MSIRTQLLRARLAGAANRVVSRRYDDLAFASRRRRAVAWEPLEERILFGYTPVYNDTPIPTTPCNGPICQCPPGITGNGGGGYGRWRSG